MTTKDQQSSLQNYLQPLAEDAKSMVKDFASNYFYTLRREGKNPLVPYQYLAFALTISDHLMTRWKQTNEKLHEPTRKKTCYLSLEFLLGRSLHNAMLNLDTDPEIAQILQKVGMDLEEIVDAEHDAGLGNGGLGRLASCFLDSCATLELPVIGYGLRYKYGMFHQSITNGEQVEKPDNWLRYGNPLEIPLPELIQRVQFGGRTENYIHQNGRSCMRWVDTSDVLAMPYDFPIPGYRNGVINTLRLWSALAVDEFDFSSFNAGSYDSAVARQNEAENITMVLYPNDSSENGKELRLRQQYFLASASLQDVIRQWKAIHGDDFSTFAEQHVFQLNDTHPTLAVAELMRLLMDVHMLEWENAWRITTACMAYTNHTLLPEALEKWPVSMFRRLLPRLLQIIEEINARFLDQVRAKWPGDTDRVRRMSLIEEGHEPQVRMPYLAIVGSFSVNGVAALHTQLLTSGLFKDFSEMWPSKFNNKTNGVTPRRWVGLCNPKLAALFDETLGSDWITHTEKLSGLMKHVDDASFRDRWYSIKQHNKAHLAALVKERCDITFSTDALFDVQVKRIHEYKRQLLNVLHVIHLYRRILDGEHLAEQPRCCVIGGKAAPGYQMAKLIILFINQVANTINRDPRTRDRLQLVFLPNYGVSMMEVVAPGTDLSEQISTAGKEASGTGNMKFMMNGAITIGTLDGANIEIREKVGAENFFLFGLTEQEVQQRIGHYDPNYLIANDPDLQATMRLIESGIFNKDQNNQFEQIVNTIRNPFDPWMVAADFRSYIDTQHEVALAYQDRERWTRLSITNSAHSGYFSSDRTINEYNKDIWKLLPY